MKTIPIRNGFFALLIIEAVVISLVTIVFIFNLYTIYTNLVYTESAEVLNLYTTIADTKLSYIEDLTYEVLSNHDIQKNLLQYNSTPNSYEAYIAVNSLYTQLFTRWVMNKSLISISYVFPDGKQVNTGQRRYIDLSGEKLEEIIVAANLADGACGWIANAAGKNTLTLYRLIKDISGNGFNPQGVLIINADANVLFNHNSVISQKYKPEIICVAGDQVLSKASISIDSKELLGFIKSEKIYDIVQRNNESCFISVKQSKLNEWHFVYILSSKEILSSIYNINIIYLIALLIIVAVMIAIGYGMANSISKPIARLTETMKGVEDGDYSAVLDVNALEQRIAIAEVVQLTRDFSQMVHKIDHLINEGYVKQLMIMEMKYKMLQQQINPHFLYNTLDTINWKALQGGNSEISVMVRSLSKMLRGSINEADTITIREDLNFVEDYIAIQKIRFEERLDFKVDITPDIYFCRIPKLTLQPIVENCIIHNLEKYSGVCKIGVVSSVSDRRLKISIEDNGRGVDLKHVADVLNGQAEAANRSIGLKNINQRIKLTFGEQYGIYVENRKSAGTRVTVILPYMEERHEVIVNC